MAAVAGLKCQVIATSLSREALAFPQQPVLFHVEQGRVSAQP